MRMPFQNVLQDVINTFTDGLGVRALRVLLFVVFVMAVSGLYVRSQFRGLKEPAAMECAQLARNIAEGRGFTTRSIRPSDLWYLSAHTGRQHDGNGFPELRHAPLFPYVLSLGYRLVRPSFEVQPAVTVFAPEKWVVIPVCLLFFLLGGLMVFRLGSLLFGRQAGMIAMLIFYFSEAVLAQAVSGLPLSLVSFLVTAASYAAIVAALRRAEHESPARWLPPFLVSALLCALSFLAGYSAIVLAPALALFLAASFGRARWVAAVGFLLVVIIAVSPWLARNRAVSGAWLGTAPHSALRGSGVYEDDSFDRQTAPRLATRHVVDAMKVKLMSNVGSLYDINLKSLGSGLVICFFLVSYFRRFEGAEIELFRWYLALALLLMMAAVALGVAARGSMGVFLPRVIVYGTGFFFALIEKEEPDDPVRREISVWVLVLLSAVTLILTLIGPGVRIPYPPYFPPFVSYVCGLMGEDETICTDIPWATAWYGNRVSILLPQSVSDLDRIGDMGPRVAGLYLTTETGNRPYTGSLVSGAERSWLPLLQRQVPGDFPLQHGIALPPGGRDQLFLTDRIRWKAPRAESEEEGSGVSSPSGATPAPERPGRTPVPGTTP